MVAHNGTYVRAHIMPVMERMEVEPYVAGLYFGALRKSPPKANP